MEKEYLLILIPAAFIVVFILLLSGCATQDTEQDLQVDVGEPVVQEQTDSQETAPVKVGNVPKEDIGNLGNIACGDGICHNREYLSSDLSIECRSLLDSCSIDVDGKKVGTEIYYICKKDCSAECNLDVDIDVCEKSDNNYEISVSDNKGNMYKYYMALYQGENLPFIKYGGGAEKWSMDLSNVVGVFGGLQSLSIMPRFENSDGTITDCSNHEKVFTSVDSC